MDDFYVLENFHRKFAILVAPPTVGTTKHLVHCKAHIFVQQMAETASKWIHNSQRCPSSKYCEIDENMWFRIWRSTVASSEATEKPQYSCTTTVPHMHNNPKDVQENLLPV